MSKEKKISEPICFIPECGRKAFFDGVSIPFVVETESGFKDLFSTKNSETNVVVPICAFHLAFAEEGLIAVSDSKKLIFLGRLNLQRFGDKSDNDIKKEMAFVKNKPEYGIGYSTLKAILRGREYEEKFK